MKTLTMTKFVVLCSSNMERLGALSEHDFSDVYDDFILALTGVSYDAQRSLCDKLRCMNYVLKELSLVMQKIKRVNEQCPAFEYISRAFFMVEQEIKSLYARMQYPHIIAVCSETELSSPLHWSKEFTMTDLVELLYSLYLLKVFRKGDGTPAEFTLIAKTFQQILNIQIMNLERQKNAAINRKLRLTGFLDTLKNALVLRSQR